MVVSGDAVKEVIALSRRGRVGVAALVNA